MAADQIELRVVVDGSGDDEALAESADRLLQELCELDVDDVRPATAGEAPAGSKGIELVALGALIVKLARSGKVLGQVVSAIRDWMSRNNANSVRLEIGGDVLEIKGVSPDERKVLIESWVQRHTGT
jgi:hypothetical protein